MRSKFVVLLMMAALAVPLAVFAGGSSGGAAVETGLEVDKLAIQIQPNPAFATISVALEKGWFEEAGFKKIDVPEFVSGNAAGEALIAGELSVWLPGNVPAIAMRHNGVPVVIVGDLSIAHNEALMVRKDAGVNKPEDLYKIRIGLVQGGTPGAVLQGIVKDNGLDASKLNLVNLAPPDDATALRNNEVQAILVWPPHPYNVMDVAEYKFNSKKYSHTRVPIVFNEKYIKDNPKAAKAIVDVLYRAQEYVIKNTTEAQQIHAKRTEQPIDLVKTMWNDYWAPNPKYGYIDENYIEDYMVYTEFLQEVGRLAQDSINILDYTYTGFLEELRPEYVEVKGRWEP